MKLSVLKKAPQFESRNDKSLGIQTFGENNDYPQQVMQIVDASVTGKPCVDVYSKFISGRGFKDEIFYGKTINRKGQTNDYILDQIAKDYALFGGFAIHVNYNANFRIAEIQHIPLETVRFEKLDEEGHFDKVAIHHDWAWQFTSLRKWKKEDIVFIDLFNPDPDEVKRQVEIAGGWYSYKGQVLYYSNQGEKVYPLPVFCNVLTDMNTQEGISNVANRNARNNFLPAGMLINRNNSSVSEAQDNETEKALLAFQGDESAAKSMYVEIESEEEKPEFLPFTGQNYDRAFENTRKAAKEDIGAAFNQPPILRAENVGANFGADLMKNAYNYYNSVTYNERLVIERVITRIFKNWFEAATDKFEVNALSYTAADQDISLIPPEILTTLTVDEKRALIGFEPLKEIKTEGE